MQKGSDFFPLGWQRRTNWHNRSFHVQLCNCSFLQLFRRIYLISQKDAFHSWSEEDAGRNILNFLRQVSYHAFRFATSPWGQKLQDPSQFQGRKEVRKTKFLSKGSPQWFRCPGWRKSIFWSYWMAAAWAIIVTGTAKICIAPSQCCISQGHN